MATPYAQAIIRNLTPVSGPVTPQAMYVSTPIGNEHGFTSNYLGNKFSRGWLQGNGSELENLGSTAFPIRPAPRNEGVYFAGVRGFGPGAPVPGLASWEVNSPGRVFSPFGGHTAEFIPSTWDLRQTVGLDPTSGNAGPTLTVAQNAILTAPLPQVFPRAQFREGGYADPNPVPPPIGGVGPTRPAQPSAAATRAKVAGMMTQ